MATFAFDSTGDAYDECQCSDSIRNGDTLDIESEGVVGLAWTWPVAVTVQHGELHRANPDPRATERVAEDAKWSREQIEAAVALAMERGYEIAEGFLGYVPSSPAP